MTVWPDVQSKMLFKRKTHTNMESSQDSLITSINITLISHTCLCGAWLKFAKILELGNQIAPKFGTALVQDSLGPVEIPVKSGIARIRPQHRNYQSWS